MGKSRRPANLFVAGLAIALVSTLALLAGNWQAAQADDGQWVGLVEAKPADGLVGNWTVRGRTFAADAATEFRDENGPLVVGACVEVEFDSSAPEQADKIATKSSDDCSSAATPSVTATASVTTTPSVTPSVSPTDDDENDEVEGLVESKPASGLTGAWVIGGVGYTATDSTRFRQDDGPLVVGACVEVEFSGTSAPFTAHEIKSEESQECENTATPTPTVTATVTATVTPSPTAPADGLEHYGHIETMPAGLVGDWVINGVTYTADEASEFDAEHGDFAVGACVKVHTTTASPPFLIHEIETAQEFRCTGGDDGGSAEGELFGLLQSFPEGLIGDWNIGGMTFVATAATEFDQEHGPFAVGVMVMVHFSIGADGLNHAREIETKFANDDDGHDDDGNGSFEGAEGHAYGLIEQFPANLSGEWIVAGVTYVATDQTEFAPNDAPFAVGVRVKVEYFIDAQGARIAQEIESTNEDSGASDEAHFTLFGFVDDMPPGGFSGEWVVDNVAFVAGAGSQFKEEHGLLGLGAFVKVEYSVQNGGKQIHEIESHVPPGAGANTAIGVIDDRGGSTSQAAGVTATVWVIGGASYTVTPATDFNDTQGPLAVGQTALVNSYTGGDGSQVATQIRGTTLDQTLHLPLVTR